MHRGFAPILIFLVITVAVIAAGAWFFGFFGASYNQLKIEDAPGPIATTPSSSPDETANWKTYTNKEIGISFQYPNNWNAKPYLTDDNDGDLDMDSVVDLSPQDYQGVIVNLSYFENPNYLSLEEWDKKRKEKAGIDFNLYEPTDLLLQTKISISSASYREKGVCGSSPCEIYTLQHGDKIYRLSSYKDISNSKDKYPGQKKIFDQILSTFKFIN